MHRGVPARRIGDRLVTTVYDLLLAQYAVSREGLPGQWPSDYDDPTVPGTPAWQAELTGVPAAAAERIGREFALNSLETGGRSMIVMGAGVNHFYHADEIYRTFLALTNMCATQASTVADGPTMSARRRCARSLAGPTTRSRWTGHVRHVK